MNKKSMLGIVLGLLAIAAIGVVFIVLSIYPGPWRFPVFR